MSLSDIVTIVAADLAARFPDAIDDVAGIATLVVVVEAEGQTIRANGCDIEKAMEFARLTCQLRAEITALGKPARGTMAAQVLARADKVAGATLAIMEPAGTA